MRARDWPEGWKRLIWLLRVGNDLEAGFLGQVIFSGANDIGGIGFKSSGIQEKCRNQQTKNRAFYG